MSVCNRRRLPLFGPSVNPSATHAEAEVGTVDAGSAWWYTVPAGELEWIDLYDSTS